MTNSLPLVKSFIRDTLGCSCPDEVFQDISCRRLVRLNSFIVLTAAVIVGNRLLIYVADAGSTGCIEEHMPVLAARGREERDLRGLNRFRLVIATDGGVTRGMLHRLFEEARNGDDNMHLHVISREQNVFGKEIPEGGEQS